MWPTVLLIFYLAIGIMLCPGPLGAFYSASAFSTVDRFFMGAFLWARRALCGQKRWFPTRAVTRVKCGLDKGEAVATSEAGDDGLHADGWHSFRGWRGHFD